VWAGVRAGVWAGRQAGRRACGRGVRAGPRTCLLVLPILGVGQVLQGVLRGRPGRTPPRHLRPYGRQEGPEGACVVHDGGHEGGHSGRHALAQMRDERRDDYKISDERDLWDPSHPRDKRWARDATEAQIWEPNPGAKRLSPCCATDRAARMAPCPYAHPLPPPPASAQPASQAAAHPSPPGFPPPSALLCRLCGRPSSLPSSASASTWGPDRTSSAMWHLPTSNSLSMSYLRARRAGGLGAWWLGAGVWMGEGWDRRGVAPALLGQLWRAAQEESEVGAWRPRASTRRIHRVQLAQRERAGSQPPCMHQEVMRGGYHALEVGDEARVVYPCMRSCVLHTPPPDTQGAPLQRSTGVGWTKGPAVEGLAVQGHTLARPVHARGGAPTLAQPAGRHSHGRLRRQLRQLTDVEAADGLVVGGVDEHQLLCHDEADDVVPAGRAGAPRAGVRVCACVCVCVHMVRELWSSGQGVCVQGMDVRGAELAV